MVSKSNTCLHAHSAPLDDIVEAVAASQSILHETFILRADDRGWHIAKVPEPGVRIRHDCSCAELLGEREEVLLIPNVLGVFNPLGFDRGCIQVPVFAGINERLGYRTDMIRIPVEQIGTVAMIDVAVSDALRFEA